MLTGTPANSRPMEPGDVVEVEVSGLGRLSQHGRRLGRRPGAARATSSRSRPTRSTSRSPCPRTRPSAPWPAPGAARDASSCAASTTSACASPTSTRRPRAGRCSSACTRRERRDGRAYLALRLRALLPGARRGRHARATTTRPSSCAAAVTLADAAAPPGRARRRLRGARRRAAPGRPRRHGIELLPYREPDDRRPGIARQTTSLPRLPPAQARPRQLASPATSRAAAPSTPTCSACG